MRKHKVKTKCVVGAWRASKYNFVFFLLSQTTTERAGGFLFLVSFNPFFLRGSEATEHLSASGGSEANPEPKARGERSEAINFWRLATQHLKPFKS